MERPIQRIQNEVHIKIKENISLMPYTSFKIGGHATYFVAPKNKEALGTIVAICKEETYPYFILGNGTNVLVADEGVEALCISMEKMDAISVTDQYIYAEAGATLGKIAQTAQQHGLTGLEFASGIPGSVGGGIFMNAGAYGGSIDQVLTHVRIVDEESSLTQLFKEDISFGYRYSSFMEKKDIIVSGHFLLSFGDRDEILRKMKELNHKRQEKQPLDMPSAGSSFKRPKDNFAGKLIMEAGLSGFSIGGAKVSEKHCGFIVNKGHAKAIDVIQLLTYVQETVWKKNNILLETELEFVGEYSLEMKEKIEKLKTKQKESLGGF